MLHLSSISHLCEIINRWHDSIYKWQDKKNVMIFPIAVVKFIGEDDNTSEQIYFPYAIIDMFVKQHGRRIFIV